MQTMKMDFRAIINNHECIYNECGLINAINRAFNRNSTKVHMNLEALCVSGYVMKRRRPAEIVVWHFENEKPFVMLYGSGKLAEDLYDGLTILQEQGKLEFAWYDENIENVYGWTEY